MISGSILITHFYAKYPEKHKNIVQTAGLALSQTYNPNIAFNKLEAMGFISCCATAWIVVEGLNFSSV